jgi:hypothetical protein
MNPFIAYGLGAGTVVAWNERERLRQAYNDIYAKAMASTDKAGVKKVAVAFGAIGYPVQANILAARARQLGQAAAGTPNVLRFPDRMMPGEVLQPQVSKRNQTVGVDPTGILTFQTDGNLVLYGPGQTVLWASNTAKKGISRLTMQTDGNLVIYDNSSKPQWASGTQGNPGAYLIVRGGSAMVVGPQGQALWTAGAPGGAGAGVLPGTPGFPGAPGMMPGMPGFPGMGMRGRHHYPGWQGPPGVGRRDEHHHHHHHHRDGQQQQQQQASPTAAPVAAPMAAPVAAPAVDPSSYAASPSVATDDSGGVSDATLDDGSGDDGDVVGDGSGGVSDVSSVMSGFGAVDFGQGYFSAYQQAGGGYGQGGYGQGGQGGYGHRHHHHHHHRDQQGQYGQQGGYPQPPAPPYGGGYGQGASPYIAPPMTGAVDPTTGLPLTTPPLPPVTGGSGMFG